MFLLSESIGRSVLSNGGAQASSAHHGGQRSGGLERRPRGDLLRDVEAEHVLQGQADGEGAEPAEGAQRRDEDRDDRPGRHNRLQMHAVEAQERGQLRLPTGRVQVADEAGRVGRALPAIRRPRHLGLPLHIRVHAEEDAHEGRGEARAHDHHPALSQLRQVRGQPARGEQVAAGDQVPGRQRAGAQESDEPQPRQLGDAGRG